MKSAKSHSKTLPLVLLILVILGMLVSAVRPHDYFTWFLEVAPILMGMPILILTFHRFRLTNLLYVLIAIHCLILMTGAHYTYAEVPLGFWMKDIFHFSRNHYDRIGHIAQGFIPAILAREILLRTSPLHRGKWLFVIVVSMCLAFSAFYEMIEWWVAISSGESANDFLGTQGDVWDTQWDMFLAMIGAFSSLLLLSKLHDKELRNI